MTGATQFACPIVWCAGTVGEHGGEGGDPDTWLHSERLRQVAPGIKAGRWQEGAGFTHWSLVLDGEANYATDVEASAALRTAADAIDALASHHS